MIRRAKSVLSGVVVSMFLVAPPVVTAASASELPSPTEHRKSHQSRSTRQPASLATSRIRKSGLTQIVPRPSVLSRQEFRTIAFLDDDAPSAADGQTAGSNRSNRFVQTGMASWYGGQRWHGKLTSSGAVYDEDALTAAHATLPLGTRVRVMLSGADRDVIVTINDRPGTRARVIDLSRAAARQLGILDRGVAMVTVTQL
jgi:rare lipoprotein A (peptidoglycan hydrolase)